MERGGRTYQTMMVHMDKARPSWYGHMPQENANLVHEIPISINHIRTRLFQERQHRRQHSRFEPVIRIEPHDPIALSPVKALVDGIGHAGVRSLCPDHVGKASRYIGAFIGGASIDHQMLQRHARRGDA